MVRQPHELLSGLSVGILRPSDEPVVETYTINNTYMKQNSIHLSGFEPAIPTSELPQVHVLDLAATGIGRIQD